MRAIATIATAECASGLRLLVSSLRKSGWTDPVHVFTPAHSAKLPLPDGCVPHRMDDWWNAKCPPVVDDRRSGVRRRTISLDQACNVPALGKPDLFLSFGDGTEVLYLDGADVMVLENPATLFDMFDHAGPDKLLGAYPYEPQADNFVPTHRSHDLLARLTAPVKMGKRYNDGVVIARMGCQVRLFMNYWRMLLGHACYIGTFAGVGARRTVVGDQVAFNICIGSLARYGHVLDLPLEWNYRGYQNVNLCTVDGGALYAPRGLRVCIAHASGSRDFRQDIKALGVAS